MTVHRLTATASVLVALAMVSGVAATTPTPTPTPTPVSSSVPLTVVIPGPTSTPTPPPAGGGGSGTGGGSGSGSSGNGSSAGGAVVVPDPAIQAPTLSDLEAPKPPSQPTDGAAKLQLDRETISAGEWMTAIGAGFTAGERVQFVLYPGVVVIGSFITDPSGTVVARFKITDQLAPGRYTVEATGWESARVANGEFLVTSVVSANAVDLWWVWLVVGALVLALLVSAVAFRDVIRGWFGGRAVPGAAA
jgi:hypothetical protein